MHRHSALYAPSSTAQAAVGMLRTSPYHRVFKPDWPNFDDPTELMAWHRDFVTCLGWAPMAIEVMVSDAEADF